MMIMLFSFQDLSTLLEEKEITPQHFDKIFARYDNIVEITKPKSIIREDSHKMPLREIRSPRSVEISGEDLKESDFDVNRVNNKSLATASDNNGRYIHNTSMSRSRTTEGVLMPKG